MANPVPGYSISTPYGRRGSHWSCNKNSQGGQHTGADWAAPRGTPVVAPIDGQIRHRKYGSAFGPHQFAISPDPGQPFGSGEVFMAHTLDRLPDGTRVTAGQQIARVGDLGNVTGPHLHLEYLPNSKGKWACGLHADPSPVVNWQPSQPSQTPPSTPQQPVEDDMAKAIFFQRKGTRYVAYPGAGTYRPIPNPQTERDIKAVLERSGQGWMEWSPGKDVDNPAAFGTRV